MKRTKKNKKTVMTPTQNSDRHYQPRCCFVDSCGSGVFLLCAVNFFCTHVTAAAKWTIQYNAIFFIGSKTKKKTLCDRMDRDVNKTAKRRRVLDEIDGVTSTARDLSTRQLTTVYATLAEMDKTVSEYYIVIEGTDNNTAK